MKLESLQALRGLAALGVTLHHCTTLVERFVGSTGALGRHASVGLLGVDLFFVLSGFIILNSHFADERGGWGQEVATLASDCCASSFLTCRSRCSMSQR